MKDSFDNAKTDREIVMKARRLQWLIENAPSIISSIRQNLDVDSDDTSKDYLIMQMEEHEMIDRVFNWNGIVGYTDSILYSVDKIRESGQQLNPQEQ